MNGQTGLRQVYDSGSRNSQRFSVLERSEENEPGRLCTPSVYSAAVYIRLSREDGDKEESDSVGNQKKLLSEYVEGQGDLVLYEIYVDDGCTGTNFDRPGFLRMMEDIQGGQVNCVVVKDLSRFGRDYIDTGWYLERVFPEQGVRFISVTDGIDSLRQSYDMLLPIKNIFNEQYARDISRKIQATMRAKQRAGEFIGAFACYGYQKDPDNRNHLVIDEYAASVVRQVYSLFLEGKGKQDIADELNAQGILCPSEYKQRCGENYRNGTRIKGNSCWTYSTIHHILQNEIYTGAMVQGKKHQNMRGRQHMVKRREWIVVPGTHEPVIEKETWEKTQKLLGQKFRALPHKYEKNPFTGLLFCGCCGKPMILNRWRRADGSTVSCFYCGTYKRRGKSFCTPHAVRADQLEQLVLGDLQKALGNRAELGRLREEIRRQSEREAIGRRRQEQIRTEASLTRVRRLKKSVYEDYQEGLLSREEFLTYAEDYEKKERFYEEQRNVLEQIECEEGKGILNGVDREKEQKIVNIGEKGSEQTEKNRIFADRQLLMELIDRIEVQEAHCLVIHYLFSEPESGCFSAE